MLTYIAISVMILLLIGMLVIKKTMASSPMLQPLQFLCVALELGLVIYVFYNQLTGGGAGKDALGRAARREEVKANVVGAYLKGKVGGKKTVVLCSFGTKETTLGKTFLEAFGKSYGEITQVELKENPDEGTGEGVPLKDVEEALKGYEDAEVIVFYGGTVPVKYERLKTKAVYFFFDQGSGTNQQIRKDIKSGKLIGLLIGKPNPPKSKAPIEDDDKVAFDNRYIIIDGGNLDELKD